MGAHTIITLRTEGDIFVLFHAGNVGIKYTISLFEILFYMALFYGVLQRISPLMFLLMKIQLVMVRFKPRAFRVSV